MIVKYKGHTIKKVGNLYFITHKNSSIIWFIHENLHIAKIRINLYKNSWQIINNLLY